MIYLSSSTNFFNFFQMHFIFMKIVYKKNSSVKVSFLCSHEIRSVVFIFISFFICDGHGPLVICNDYIAFSAVMSLSDSR